MAYHHILDISQITQKLFSFLRPGGQLLVADYELLDLEGSPPDDKYSDIVAHPSGIVRPTIWAAFSQAGLEKLTWETVIEHAKLHGRSVRVFLAGGTRPGARSS